MRAIAGTKASDGSNDNGTLQQRIQTHRNNKPLKASALYLISCR
jgi:hypothetical protein